MAERRIIDLKSGTSSVIQRGVVYRDSREIRPQQPASSLPAGRQAAGGPAPSATPVTPKVLGAEAESIEWTAYEYENRLGTKYGILSIAILALLLIVYGIFAGSYLFIGFVIISFALLYFFAKKEPRLLRYSVTPQGIYVGSKRFDYASLQSFWIFEELHISEISLETKNRLQKFVALPLGDANPAAIRDVLHRYLPEKEQESMIIDQIAKILGF